MANLKLVVEQLKQQNESLTSVSELLNTMLQEDIAARKERERAAGDELEKQREESAQAKPTSTVPAAPTSFGQGLAQGTGLDALTTSIKDMLPGFMTGAGLLGGATVGGLIGKGIGRLFFPALAAFFASEYLDDWIDPLVDKITGDDATWTMFGKEIDASKIVSGFAGAFAVIFGKDAIIQAAKGLLGVGDDTKIGNLRKIFVRRLGLGAVIGVIGTVLGDKIGEITGSEEIGNAISLSAQFASLGMMFGPQGAIIFGLVGLAVSGALWIKDWLDKRREKMKAEFQAEVDKFKADEELNAKSDAALIAKAQQIAEQVAVDFAAGDPNKTITPVEQEAYIQELESRSPEEAELALLKNEIATQIAEFQRLVDQGATLAATSLIEPLKELFEEYEAITGVAHPAASLVMPIQKELAAPSEAPVVQPAPPVPFERYVKEYDTFATSMEQAARIKADPYAYFGPSQYQKDEAALMAQPIPGTDYMSAERQVKLLLSAPSAERQVERLLSAPTIIQQEGATTTGGNIINIYEDNSVQHNERISSQSQTRLGGGSSSIDQHYRDNYFGIRGHGMYGF